MAEKSKVSEIEELLKILLRNEDIHDNKVASTGSSEKGDGYMSDVQFIDVTGKNSKGKACQYHLVLKSGKTDKQFRQRVPARSLYENEIYVYNTVIPNFQNLLKANNQPPFDNVAKCFSTYLKEDEEYLAFENLKTLGYDLHDKKLCLNSEHLRITLGIYAKWHALSFVLKDQNRVEFDQLSSELKKAQEELCSMEINFFLQIEEMTEDLLKDAKEFDLLEKFRAKYCPMYDNWYKLLLIDEPESVITHGDCWNNNFLFQYKDAKLKENPINAVMLDFQLTRLASPVFDLSYHLFSTCSGKDMDNLSELLTFYYQSLAENIRKLNGNPEKIFPFSKLVEHWKKYHLFGFMMSIMILPSLLIAKKDTLNMEEVKDWSEENLKGLEAEMMSKIRGKLIKRAIPLIRHATEYDL